MLSLPPQQGCTSGSGFLSDPDTVVFSDPDPVFFGSGSGFCLIRIKILKALHYPKKTKCMTFFVFSLPTDPDPYLLFLENDGQIL